MAYTDEQAENEGMLHTAKCTVLCGDCAVCGTHESILHNCGGRYVCTGCWLSGAYAA